MKKDQELTTHEYKRIFVICSICITVGYLAQHFAGINWLISMIFTLAILIIIDNRCPIIVSGKKPSADPRDQIENESNQ